MLDQQEFRRRDQLFPADVGERVGQKVPTRPTENQAVSAANFLVFFVRRSSHDWMIGICNADLARTAGGTEFDEELSVDL